MQLKGFSKKNIDKLKLLGVFPTKLKNGRVAFNIQKRVKWVGGKKPNAFRGTIGYYGVDSIDALEDEAQRIHRLCNKGLSPREHDKQQKIKEIQEEEAKENKSKTFREVVDTYSNRMFDAGRNSPDYIRERFNCITSVSADWLDKPMQSITFEMVDDIFHSWSYQRNYRGKTGSAGRAKSWGRYCLAIWNWSLRRKIVTDNPFITLSDDVGGFQSGEREGNYLLPNETAYIIEHLKNIQSYAMDIQSYKKEKGTYKKNKHFNSYHTQCWAMVLLLYTGLRLKEVIKLKWEHVFLPNDMVKGNKHFNNALIPHFIFPKGSRKQKQIPYAVPIVWGMLEVFRQMMLVRTNEYVFKSAKVKSSHISTIDYALKRLRPPSLDDPKLNTTGVGDALRIEKFTQVTLRRTWTNIGVSLGYDLNMLNFISGRSKSLKSSTSIKSYTSQSLQTAIPYFKNIIKELHNNDEEVLEVEYMEGLSQEQLEEFTTKIDESLMKVQEEIDNNPEAFGKLS